MVMKHVQWIVPIVEVVVATVAIVVQACQIVCVQTIREPWILTNHRHMMARGPGVSQLPQITENAWFLGCLNFECTNKVVEYEALVLSLQRTISLNAAALKVILHPTNSVGVFKDITIDEGKHERPLKTATKGKKGNLIPEGGVFLNMLYGLQNLCQGPRNSGTHRTTTTNR